MLWEAYFSSVDKIVVTTLEVRVHRHPAAPQSPFTVHRLCLCALSPVWGNVLLKVALITMQVESEEYTSGLDPMPELSHHNSTGIERWCMYPLWHLRLALA